MVARRILRAACVAAGLLAAQPLAAQELRMAYDSEWSAIDPHYHSFPQNLSVSQHVFDALLTTDAELNLKPQLAESWVATDATSWEFKLRRGVKFHDGSDFTAEDVAATLTRIPKVPNSPGPITTFIRPIVGWEIKDPYTIVLKTKDPSPVLPTLLTNVYIIPKRFVEATTDDFNTGKAAIGTGPFRFVSWSRGDRLRLERNDAYWGEKPAWSKAEIRVITNIAAREAALLAGDVDFIQNPSTNSVPRLSGDPKLAVHKATSTRITYLQFNQKPQELLGDLKGTGGRNPFADPKVRKAFSMAIPRALIAERLMGGLSVPASQIVPPEDDIYNPDVKVEPYDVDRARKLLAEAGYPNGFEVSLATPNDRNINGVKIAEAIAASLSRAGVKVSVNALPLNIYINEWRKGTYSFYMHGAGPPPSTLLLLPQMVATKNMQTAMGVSNESGYSNPKLDDILQRAMAEIDDAKRRQLFRDAARIAYDETAILPLHHEVVVWASRGDLSFTGRPDALTYAMSIKPR